MERVLYPRYIGFSLLLHSTCLPYHFRAFVSTVLKHYHFSVQNPVKTSNYVAYFLDYIDKSAVFSAYPMHKSNVISCICTIYAKLILYGMILAKELEHYDNHAADCRGMRRIPRDG